MSETRDDLRAAHGVLYEALQQLEAANAQVSALQAEVEAARALNRDLHRRVQKAESFRARHGNTYGVKARWRDRQRRRKAEAERDEAIKDMEASEAHAYGLDEKLASLSPHGTCACSYDRPGDVCMHHSPALAEALAEVERLQKVEGERENGRVPDGTGLSPDGQTASRSDPSDFDPSRDRALLADLERELGVRGASAVFRKSLALAKKAAAAAREEVMPHDRRPADRTEGAHVDCPGEEVRASRGAQMILDGLNDALAFAQGDESRATLRAFIVEGGKVTEVSPPFDYALPKQAPPAQGMEARQGRDACGSVHDGPVAIGDAPSDNPLTETKEGSEHV